MARLLPDGQPQRLEPEGGFEACPPRIDAEFAGLVPPLSEQEHNGLEASLLAEGCRDALVVWQDHDVLLDGHSRLRICQRHGLPYRTVSVELPDRAAARLWIIKHQLGRRNLTAFQRAELALALKPTIAEQARLRQGTRTDLGQTSGRGGRTDEALAAIAGVSDETMRKAAFIVENGPEAVKEQLRRNETGLSVSAAYEDLRRREARRCGASVPSDPDLVPPLPTEPVSRYGDVWSCGPHRIACLDSTKAEDVALLMDGEHASLMVTDPPYLVDYDGSGHPHSWANRPATKDKSWDAYRDHEQAVGFYMAFLNVALQEALAPDAAVYQCYAILRSEFIWQAWREVGLLPHAVCIWRKSRAVLTHSWFMWDFEPLMVGWPKGHQPKAKPPASERAVWEIGSAIEDGAVGIHPTQKPVELFRRPIEWHSAKDGVIYEPFSGSGTCLIAAEMTGRRCYAVEISPQFVDQAILRWQRFSGREATLAGDGRSFAAVATERVGTANTCPQRGGRSPPPRPRSRERKAVCGE